MKNALTILAVIAIGCTCPPDDPCIEYVPEGQATHPVAAELAEPEPEPEPDAAPDAAPEPEPGPGASSPTRSTLTPTACPRSLNPWISPAWFEPLA